MGYYNCKWGQILWALSSKTRGLTVTAPLKGDGAAIKHTESIWKAQLTESTHKETLYAWRFLKTYIPSSLSVMALTKRHNTWLEQFLGWQF